MPETCRKKYPNDKVKRKACSRLNRRAATAKVKGAITKSTKKAGSFFKKTFNDSKDVITGKKKIVLKDNK